LDTSIGEFQGWGDFVMLFPLWSSLSATTQHVGKAGGLQLLRCWGFESVFALRATPRQGKELRLHPQTPWLWSPQTFATLGWISTGISVQRSSVQISSGCCPNRILLTPAHLVRLISGFFSSRFLQTHK